MAYLKWRAEAGDNQDTPSEHTGGVSPLGTFFIVFFVLLVVGAVGWVVFTQLRARRLGLPAPSWSSYIPCTSRSSSSAYGAPSPAPGGIRGWFSDKFSALRGGRGGGGGGGGGRSAPGAYERRGFGPLDPDEAWDTRVGAEADGPYGYSGGGYGGGGAAQELGTTSRAFYGGRAAHHDDDDDDDDHGYPERGRTRSRSPAAHHPGAGGLGARNPFDDDAEPSNVSMRGVSPRPIDTSVAGAQRAGGHGRGGSPTSERRSIFRENV